MVKLRFPSKYRQKVGTGANGDNRDRRRKVCSLGSSLGCSQSDEFESQRRSAHRETAWMSLSIHLADSWFVPSLIASERRNQEKGRKIEGQKNLRLRSWGTDFKGLIVLPWGHENCHSGGGR